MRFLRQNTACRVTVGPFFDKTDGITPEVALTVTNEKLTFLVDDSNVPTLVLDTAPTASGGNNDMIHVSGDDSGFYDLELTAANTNYVGRAMLALTDAANHCPVFHEFMIVPQNVYDSLILGTDNIEAALIADYDASKFAASQDSVDAIDAILDILHDTDIPAIKTVVDANGAKLVAVQNKTDMLPAVWFSP